jgi:AcrR family transcriptional regulator
MSADGGPSQSGGLRERNKRDKLERIVAAAREAFGKNGFEATALRDVAAAANIGTGTLFLYAHTKEDLLVLVFKRELEPVIASGFVAVPDADLLIQLLYCFNPVTEHHSRNMVLSKPFLKDVIFVSEAHVAEVVDFIARWNGRVAHLVDKAKERGEIRADIDSNQLARCARQLFLANLRLWVAGQVPREVHEAETAAALRLLLAGLAPEKRSRGANPRSRQIRRIRGAS